MNPCAVCGDQGFVYRASVEGGHAIWNGAYVECPICFLNNLIGA